METLIKTCLSIFVFGSIYCQSYKITVLGYHTTDVTQTIHDSGRIEFNAQNRGLAGMIWPMNNYYRTTYDIQNFTLKGESVVLRTVLMAAVSLSSARLSMLDTVFPSSSIFW